MKHFVNLLTWILIAFGGPMATEQLGAAQASKPQPVGINTRINKDALVENQRLEYILLGLLQGTGLHGGFVEVAGCSDLPKGRLQIKQGVTVRQALDVLVAANPGYQWELRDGVVNLMPRAGAPLLRTKIAKFQMNATDREIGAVLHPRVVLPKSCKFSQIKSSTLLHNISPPRRKMECRSKNVLKGIARQPLNSCAIAFHAKVHCSLFLARNSFARNNLRLSIISRVICADTPLSTS